MRLQFSWLISLVLHALLGLLLSLASFAVRSRDPHTAGMEIEIIDRENAMPLPQARLASSATPTAAIHASTLSPPALNAPGGSPAAPRAPGQVAEPALPAPAGAETKVLGPAPVVAPASTMPPDRPVPPQLVRPAAATVVAANSGQPAPVPGTAAPAQPRGIDVTAVARLLPPGPTQPARVPRLNSAAIGQAIGRAVPKGGRALTFREKVDLVRLIRSQITPCWNPPPPDEDDGRVTISLRIRLDQRGALVGAPAVSAVSGQTATNAAYASGLASSVRRAAMRCSPLKLPPELHEAWSDIELNFDPRDIT